MLLPYRAGFNTVIVKYSLYLPLSNNRKDNILASSKTLWLKRLSQGEDAGIKWLFEQYYVSLVLFAHTYVLDRDVAKDMVQDVFFGLLEKRENFTDIDNLKVYLYSAVKNKCLKYIRHEDVKERYEQYMLTNENVEETYLERILEEEVFGLLNEAIQSLPQQCKNVFLLTLEGKSNAEIAEILHIGIETVKSHKKAGKKILYAKLKDVVSCVMLVFYMSLLSR